MAEYAPDPRAQALADRIAGKRTADAEAVDVVAKGMRIGQREEEADDEPVQRKPVRQHDDDSDELEEEAIDDEEEDESDDDELGRDESPTEEDDEDETEDDDQEDGEEYEEVAYSDDDAFEVTVDGETRVATLRDLKKAFSGEGAIEKRLHEATEERKAARAERAAVQVEVQEHRANLLRTIQQLDQALFQPLVNKPDAKLRQRDINAYLMQKDAYDEDQERLRKSREGITQFFGQEQQKMAKAREEFRANEMALLVERLPEIRDEVKGPKVYQEIMEAAAHYGFSMEQVASIDHHGAFLMARDAARWLNMQKLKANGGPASQRLVRKRRLTAGGATSSKIKTVRSQKEQQAATKRAQATGRVDDVAAMLVSKAKVRGNPKGARRQ
jgi:hypothetical protein